MDNHEYSNPTVEKYMKVLLKAQKAEWRQLNEALKKNLGSCLSSSPEDDGKHGNNPEKTPLRNITLTYGIEEEENKVPAYKYYLDEKNVRKYNLKWGWPWVRVDGKEADQTYQNLRQERN